MKLGKAFREWIVARDMDGVSVSVTDEEHMRLTTAYAEGAVNFYCFEGMPEICEMSVVRSDTSESLFFLHFELEDERRAHELFDEMCEVLTSLGERTTTRVLLCCTAGFTTSMFAAKLQEAADTLSLAYEFSALPLEQAEEEGGTFDAVMLAPQVGFRRREAAEAFAPAVVFEIPAKVFGAYDAAGCLRMLMGLLGDDALSAPDPTDLRVVREMSNDKRILLVSIIRKPKNSVISWRLFDRFRLVDSDEVHKCRVDYRDIEDVLATLRLRGHELAGIDAVGVAVPGAVDFGRITFSGEALTGVDIERSLRDKFSTTVFVDNNANAGAVGCYVTQDTYDSVVLHTQQTGFLMGGQGTVSNGHLLRGRRGMAGELRPLNERVFLQGGMHLPELLEATDRELAVVELGSDIAWRADRMLPILATTLIASISVVAPDAIYVSYDLIDDMDALRAELATCVDEELLPDLIHIDDYHEKIFAGEMALVLQRLNTSAT